MTPIMEIAMIIQEAILQQLSDNNYPDCYAESRLFNQKRGGCGIRFFHNCFTWNPIRIIPNFY